MKFSVEPKIFERFPGIEIGVLVITGMNNKGHSEEVLRLLREEEKRQKELLAGVELGSLPEVSIWRRIYKDFGSHPRDYSSSVEALLRRARGGERPLPQINNLVDLYNYLSVKYHLPAGAEDLDKIEGDIELTFATGAEKGKYIGGKEEDTCYEGEVIYKDKAGFICRRWNWREADRTKIEFDTENCVLVVEKAPGLDDENFKKAIAEAEDLLIKLSTAKVQRFILTEETNSFEISFKTGGKAAPVRDRKTKIKAVLHKPSFFSEVQWETEDTISYRLKKLIYEALKEVQPEVVENLKISDIILEHPKQENYGDYSTNIAMKLAGRLKMKPVDLADKLKDQLNKYTVTYQSTSSASHSKSSSYAKNDQEPILEKIVVAGPGFLNLWLRIPTLITSASSVLKNKETVITSQILKDRKISVEYTDPNPFKEFHLGHMYSNFIGEAIARMFEALGATVWRADYYGDVGMHIAKSLYGFLAKLKTQNSLACPPGQAKLKSLKGKEYLDELKKEIDKLDKLSVSQRQKFLGEGYALGVRKYDEDKNLQEEIKDINYLVYIAAQEVLKKDKGWQPIVNYRKSLQGKENRLEEIRLVYEVGLRWSLEYFETIYKRLGTKFNGYYPESWVGEYGIKLVEKGLEMGVMEKDEGAIVYKGEREGLHTRVFVNKLGLPTYEAKELGLAPAKYGDFKYDLSVIVTGNEIKEYFYVVLTVLRKIAPDLGEKTLNVSHGMVKLPEGKMSSRTGNVITFEGLLEEAKKYALKIMKDADLPQGEKQKVAETVGLAAVRYALLKSNIGLDVTFDFDKSVSFEGDSGPYLLYTYARCRSVLRKSKVKSQKSKVNYQLPITNYQFNSEELVLLRTLYKFPEVVIESARSLSPNLICSFLFDLAQKYNLFYNKHSILQPATDNPQLTTDFRLFLTFATSEIIKKGLYLFGIETVERM